MPAYPQTLCLMPAYVYTAIFLMPLFAALAIACHYSCLFAAYVCLPSYRLLLSAASTPVVDITLPDCRSPRARERTYEMRTRPPASDEEPVMTLRDIAAQRVTAYR